MSLPPTLDPSAYNPPPRSRGPCIIASCCSCAALAVVLLIVAGYYAYRSGTRALQRSEPVARRFLELMAAGRLDDAYALTSREFQRQTSKEAFRRFGTVWQREQGDVQAMTRIGVHWYAGTGGRTTTLVYDLRGSRRASTVQIVLRHEDGLWRVQACNLSNSRPAQPGAPARGTGGGAL